ncbi:hypothetical protein [Micromonospora sp. NBRC 101691]|uniref:hypothetical protein n=1 Tax=Micromonospora sp. NBRC 101691 TaxID=3032198 RepID=UPI0024A110B6|nr:hypothetical protein [Micromonospora sp. NBRC 101691]GLY21721.1 hypothetical protein Misp04_14530 [Micromonospora sp. NBRC 101691]
MSKIARRRWVRAFIVTAGLTGGAILTLSALDSDPAAAADRPPLPAIVDRAERAVDRVLDRPDREYPPRVLPRHHRPPVDCEDPADHPPTRKVRPAKPPTPPEPVPDEPTSPPPAEPVDQGPAEPPAGRPTPPAVEPAKPTPPAAPEPPREPILDVPPLDVPPIVVDIPVIPVPPVSVDLPPLLPVTSPTQPQTPVEPAPVEPAPVDAPPAPPTTPRPAAPRPVTPAPAAPAETDPAAVASPRAGPSGRPRADRGTEQADPGRDAVKPCEQRRIVRQGPRVQPKTTTAGATRRPGKCPGEGPGAVVDGTQPSGLKPPAGGVDLPCLTATGAIATDDTLTRVAVARARAHLDSRGVAALDPRPA